MARAWRVALVHAVEAALDDQLVAAGDRGVRAAALGHVADALAHALRFADEVHARDAGLAARRREERRQHAQGRRLAGAVGPEEAEDLAAFDPQVHPAHRLDDVLALPKVRFSWWVSMIGPGNSIGWLMVWSRSFWVVLRLRHAAGWCIICAVQIITGTGAVVNHGPRQDR